MSHLAAIYPAKQAPFEVKSRTTPTPANDQLLVKIEATALNPIDWKIPAFGIIVENFPAVIGSDIAGTVEKVGSSVTNFAPGDKVFFQGVVVDPDQAGLQQYTVVPSDIVSKIPSNISTDEAATIPLTLTTAFVGLFHSTGLDIPPPFSGPTVPANTAIYIGGGSSQVAEFAIQLAKIAGFSRIVTVAHSRHAAALKALGATDVIDRAASDAEAQARKAVGSDLIYAFDAIGAPDTQLFAYGLLSDTKPGRLASTLPVPAEQPKKADGTTWGSIFGSSHAYRDLSVPYWKAVGGWVAEGKIKPAKTIVLKGGLNAIQEGLKQLQEGKVSGEKLVIRPWET